MEDSDGVVLTKMQPIIHSQKLNKYTKHCDFDICRVSFQKKKKQQRKFFIIYLIWAVEMFQNFEFADESDE